MDNLNADHSTTQTSPLVSILCRSMNRPELVDALASVERQTYPNIEIILVDARGKGLERYQAMNLQTPVREVSGAAPWNRPAAANIALKNAHGSYLMFLDEDDWIADSHVASLVETLEADPEIGVAYSSTQKTTAAGMPTPDTFRVAYDPALLHRDNFIPIHSALFRKTLINQGCRFDESLDIFEDWDFWLQLSAITPFVHVDTITAFYRQGGDSNTASNSPSTRYLAGHPIAEARAKIFQKWLPIWSIDDVNRLLGSLDQSTLIESLHSDIGRLSTNLTTMQEQERKRTDEIRDLGQQIIKLNQNLNRKTAELADAATHIDGLTKDVHMLLGSMSWRVTRPLRWMKRKITALRGLNESHPVHIADTPVSSGSDAIFCNLDIPNSTQNEFPEQITLQGWACAVAGLERIEARVDGVLHDTFGTGTSRPDIAQHLPEVPDSFSAGFYQEINLPEVRAGEHSLELTFIDKSGNKKRITCKFSLFKNSDLYDTWYWRNSPNDEELRSMEQQATASNTPEVFHLLLSTNDNDDDLLNTLSSLRSQAWPHWSLHLSEAKSDRVQNILNQGLGNDVTVHWHGSLAAALTTLEDATGLVTFLSAGESLAPHALYEIARSAEDNAAAIFYSDHDVSAESCKHEKPCFTPQWSPEHLLSSNYVGGIYAVRSKALSGWRDVDLESPAWRYGCLLAFAQLSTEIATPAYRIPMVLWSSNVSDEEQNSAEMRMVERTLAATCPAATITSVDESVRAVSWPLTSMPKVSIIIPTMGKLELVAPCINSLLEITAYKNYEVIILDNGRGAYPEGIQFLKDKEFKVIECNEPFNWARLNNIGTRHASGELYLFLNDDIEITDPDWLEQLVRQAIRPATGTVGARLLYPNGALQHVGVLLVNYGGGGIHLLHKRMPAYSIYRQMHSTVREVSANTGACLMVSKVKFDEIKGFDEELAVVGNDVDFCLRLSAKGYRNIWTPLCTLIHHESISRKTSVPKENEKAMWQRWGDHFIAGDSYYNPNLSQEKGDFTLQVNNARVSPFFRAFTASAGPARKPLQPGVNLIGYTRAEMGIGEGARSDAKALDAANEPFGIVCFQSGNPSRMTDLSWAHKEIESAPYDITILHINPDHAYQAISELPATHFDDHYRIGYWAWELPEIPPDWEKAFVHFDEIWVPSNFVQDAIAMKSPIPVVRIPHAIEVKVDHNLNRGDFGLPDDVFLFLAMFDTHSRPERKNPFGAIRAFKQAFAADDMSVRLVLKVNNPTPDGMRAIQDEIGEYTNFILLNEVYSRSEVNALISNTDCYVSLHRSEGFGFGPAEAMALGKAVMATNWSGNVDYMRPGNSVGIDYRLVEIAQDHGPYKKGQWWAEPYVEQAAQSMQTLAGNRSLTESLGRKAQITIEEEFSPIVVGNMMRKRLSAIRKLRSLAD